MPRARTVPEEIRAARQKDKRGASATPEAKAQRIQERRVLDAELTQYEIAERVSPDKPLTDKQKLFARLWAQGESINTAVVLAGYENSPGLGYRMARMPNILAVYNKEKQAYEASVQMTRKRVMEGFLESIELAKLMAEPTAMIAGWREIARMCGYFEPVKRKVEVSIQGQVAMQRLEKLSDEELMKVVTATVENVVAEEAMSEGEDDA